MSDLTRRIAIQAAFDQAEAECKIAHKEAMAIWKREMIAFRKLVDILKDLRAADE